MEVMNDFKFYL